MKHHVREENARSRAKKGREEKKDGMANFISIFLLH
jgi:hypothetical protein